MALSLFVPEGAPDHAETSEGVSGDYFLVINYLACCVTSYDIFIVCANSESEGFSPYFATFSGFLKADKLCFGVEILVLFVFELKVAFFVSISYFITLGTITNEFLLLLVFSCIIWY